MDSINAFIGHSFTEDDELINRKFLDFFDTIKELGIPFNWDHAEKAKPQILSDKVLQKMKDANTFIGICTKKERVILAESLKKIPFFRNRYFIGKNDFAVKTSDWIIQEIGCAFGRELKIILLIEKGLRPPGGLQGNLEYLEFERDNPEKVFQKILEMIQDLIPKTQDKMIIQIEQTDKPANKIEKSIKDESKQEYSIEIKDTWEKDDFNKGLIDAVIFENHEKQNEIIEKYSEKFCLNNPEERMIFKAKSLHYNYLTNKINNLDEIKSIFTEYPKNPELNQILGNIYENCDQYELAFSYYYNATKYSLKSEDKIKNLSNAINAYLKQDKHDFNKYLDEIIEIDTDNNNKEIFYRAILQIANKEKNNFLYTLALEAAITEYPLDSNLRFDLAYKYSEINKNELSYYHYKFLCKHSDINSTFYNNMGVAAANLQLHGKSVDAYRKAEELEETLAMSNLAYKFIDQGFYKEAEEICNKGLKIKDYHKNIITALSTIEHNKKNEADNEKKYSENVEILRKTIVYISNGLYKKSITHLKNKYSHPDCTLNVTLIDNVVKFSSFYKRKNYLASLLMKQVDAKYENEVMDDYYLEIEGKIICHLIEGKYLNILSNTKEKDKLKSQKDIIMIVSDNLEIIEVYDKLKYEKLFDLRFTE